MPKQLKPKAMKLWIKYSNQLPTGPATLGAFNCPLLNAECLHGQLPSHLGIIVICYNSQRASKAPPVALSTPWLPC